jgi:hypothetical protein
VRICRRQGAGICEQIFLDDGRRPDPHPVYGGVALQVRWQAVIGNRAVADFERVPAYGLGLVPGLNSIVPI